MKKIFLPSLFVLGFATGMPFIAYAQNVQFVPPVTTESGETVEVEDDALNYFATNAEERKAIEAKKAAAPEGHVPASELEYLPEELELDGKAKLKIEGGRIQTNASGQTYGYCEDFEARGETVPDSCIQKGGAEQPVNSAAPEPQQATAPSPASLQPQTLDEQLEAKGDAAPEPATADANTGTQNSVDTGTHIENTAVVDKARGAKTNIISNTDTGVKLDY